MNIKPHLSYILKVIFAGALIAYLVTSGHLDLSVFLDVKSYAYLGLAVLCSTLNLFLITYRWQLLANHLNFKLTFTKAFQLNLIGSFFNFALPSTVGGDGVKAYYISDRFKHKQAEALSSVLVDRYLGLYAMLGVSSLALLFGSSHAAMQGLVKEITWFIYFGFIAISFSFVLLFSKTLTRHRVFQKLLHKIPNFLKELITSLLSYQSSLKLFLMTIVLSFIILLFGIGFMVFMAYALGFQIPLSIFFFAVPIGLIITALPLSPGGIGVGQVAFLVLFQQALQGPSQVGQVIITADQALHFAWGLVGAYLYLKRYGQSFASKPLKA